MADPVAFEFETAKQLMRLLKKSKDGTFNSEVDDEIPLDHAPAFVWAYVPNNVLCSYDSGVGAWFISGAVFCYPILSGKNSSGDIQYGKNNSDGIVTGGITCTTFIPRSSAIQAAPTIGKGSYLGTIFGYDGSENPRVLIPLPPAPAVASGSATIEVLTNVVCTPTGLELSTVTLSGADYDNAVIKQFLALSDVIPSSYLGNQGRVVKVNDTATGLEFGPIGEGPTGSTFIALTDTPNSYAGAGSGLVTSSKGTLEFKTSEVTVTKSITGGGNTLGFFTALQLENDLTTPGVSKYYGTHATTGARGWRSLTLQGATDYPASYADAQGKFLKVNSAGNAVIFSSAFTLKGATDFPADYTGAANKLLKVNSAETAVVFSAFTLKGATDFPATYTGSGGKFLKVNSSGTAVEFTSVDIAGMLSDIADLKARVTALEAP